MFVFLLHGAMINKWCFKIFAEESRKTERLKFAKTSQFRRLDEKNFKYRNFKKLQAKVF